MRKTSLVQIPVTEETHAEWRGRAALEGVSLAELVRTAMEEFLEGPSERLERPATHEENSEEERRAFLQKFRRHEAKLSRLRSELKASERMAALTSQDMNSIAQGRKFTLRATELKILVELAEDERESLYVDGFEKWEIDPDGRAESIRTALQYVKEYREGNGGI